MLRTTRSSTHDCCRPILVVVVSELDKVIEDEEVEDALEDELLV